MSIKNILRNHFFDVFPPVVFSSILGLWAVLPLVPGHLGSAKCGLPLVAWATSWTSRGLVTPTNSVSHHTGGWLVGNRRDQVGRGRRDGGREYWERRLELGVAFSGHCRNLMQWELTGVYESGPRRVSY